MEAVKNEESWKIKRHSMISNVLYIARHYKTYEPAVLGLCGAEILFYPAVQMLGIYLPKLTVELVMKHPAVNQTLPALGVYTVFMMLAFGAKDAAGIGKYHLYNMQRERFAGNLFLKSLKIPYKHTEQGHVKSTYWKAYQAFYGGDMSAGSVIVSETVSLLGNLLCLFSFAAVLSMLNVWVIAALTGLSFLNYFISMYQIRYIESKREEQAGIHKRFMYIKSAMGNVHAAKDIRIFGMGGWLRQMRDEVIGEHTKLGKKLAGRKALCGALGFLLTMGRDFAAYAYLIVQAAGGKLTAGAFVLYFGAVTGFSDFVMNIMRGAAGLREASDTIDYVRAYMGQPDEYAGEKQPQGHAGEKQPDKYAGAEPDGHTGAGRRHRGLSMPVQIEFRDVCFSYDTEAGCPKQIFDHFNLTIHAGEKLALVGVNGAGKTTLVKLLCGIYEPDAGTILFNGIDGKEFSKKELYGLFSAVFQEPLILPFTVGENLAMKPACEVDEKRAWDALARAGMAAFFQKRKITLDSYMKKDITEQGIELSGGWQQRFLMARALYRDAPIMLLDEPTAALDPIAESEVYDQYQTFCKDKTAVFISHRLASTRFSDRIVLLDAGKILESGTHGQLMQLNGAYAKMFRVQSNYYNLNK